MENELFQNVSKLFSCIKSTFFVHISKKIHCFQCNEYIHILQSYKFQKPIFKFYNPSI